MGMRSALERVHLRRQDDSSPTVIKPSICVLEAEAGIANSALQYLENREFVLHRISYRGNEVQYVQQLHPSLTVITANTLDKRALGLCRALRKVTGLAGMPLILFAANSGSEEDCILALEAGADDYVTRVTGERELLARVRALLRRFARQALRSGLPNSCGLLLHVLAGTPGPAIKAGDIEIDTYAMKIWVRGVEIVATALEFRLIYYLAHNQARVFTRDQLLEAVWGTPHLESRSVDACVRRLRNKIERDRRRPTYLRTIRGVGYCFDMGGITTIHTSNISRILPANEQGVHAIS